jgi:hypothetical protein
MAKFDAKGILTGLENTLKAVQDMMPVAQALGLPAVVANVSTIAIAGIAVAQNLLERGSNLKDALSTADESKLRSMIGELQKVNDTLAGQIAADAEEAAEEASSGAGGGAGGG